MRTARLQTVRGSVAPSPDVARGGSSNEQIWTGLQCWPLDVSSQEVVSQGWCLGVSETGGGGTCKRWNHIQICVLCSWNLFHDVTEKSIDKRFIETQQLSIFASYITTLMKKFYPENSTWRIGPYFFVSLWNQWKVGKSTLLSYQNIETFCFW